MHTTQIPNDFWIERDSEYGIFVSNDNNRGVAVQVCFFKEQLQQLADGKIVSKGVQSHVLWQEVVATRKEPAKSDSPTIPPVEFKRNVGSVIQKARAFMQSERQGREMCMGTLNDYWGNAKKLNEPETK